MKRYHPNRVGCSVSRLMAVQRGQSAGLEGQV